LAVPFTTIVGWVFVMMELVGDYSENPFEGLPNDIPMKALCRTIEICWEKQSFRLKLKLLMGL
jgi:putative membrane protein